MLFNNYYRPLCSVALVPNVLPRRDEGSGKMIGYDAP